MGFFDRFRRKDDSNSPEVRRARLLEHGRLTDGVVIETETSDNGKEVVTYEYWVHGVNFESSEYLTESQMAHSGEYVPGATISIRFDPRNHGNSIIV